MDLQESHHDIPQSFLDRLETFVNGGFILAFINKEGETVVLNTIEHPTLNKGVRGMMEDYLDFMEEEEKMIQFEIPLDDEDFDENLD